MSVSNPVMTVGSEAPGVGVIVITGDVTASCEQALMAAHEQVTDADARVVILDFAHMAYMNSGGIGMLVTLLVRAQRRAQRVAAVGLNDHYRQIFALTRLDEAIELHDDVATAVAAVG